ncbi:DMT family transporter [Devosia neptuniae]|jgi:drug/metabolite transporter (DMT)-like permease|uniref:DMT family transporter n=1 Tax=Devosia TaxID=46913 RepID=UPI0022AF845D|nr:DMT family transporter [Devosia neptuniae]MCZ4345683.1 DMT family transporter [Devosia neptuniae]|tara:strand:+ start:21634 stop:22557 length:924 start_codon:yes stop_codon:yes gene_type:complete
MSLSAIDDRADNVGRAIALTLFTIAVFGIQDAMSKHLVQTYSPFQVTMMRYWGFAAFALYIVSRQAGLRQALSSKVPLWQLLRGSLLIIEICVFALALQTVPLGELQAISLVYPLLVTLFSIPLLGEKVGVFRFVAVGVGFAGALIIVRPGGLPLDWGVGFAMIAAVLYSLYIVLTRKVSQYDKAPTSLAYTGIVGLVLSSGVGIFFWQPMAWPDVALVVTMMITTCLGHGVMIYALSLAPASTVQPFNYFALPWAIVLSMVVFGHYIDPISLLGAGIVVAAGLVVMARERIKRVRIVDGPILPGRE